MSKQNRPDSRLNRGENAVELQPTFQLTVYGATPGNYA